MAKDKKFAEIIVQECDPLRDVDGDQLRVRIVEPKDDKGRGKGVNARRLDIRQYKEGESYTGFTRKGVRLSFEEFQLFEKMIADIKTAFIRTASAPAKKAEPKKGGKK